jgi:hypothetical protein
VALFLLWAIHDGGYDSETWYWGALASLALFAVVVVGFGVRRNRPTRAAAIALALFALYVAWSYLSIAWASSPGDALQGSNRALLYLLLFALALLIPWTSASALTALVVFATGIGVIGIVLIVRLGTGDHVASLVIEGRLAAPTGYFNATAALFTIGALMSTALSSRRELPGLLRGLLVALACADLQLAMIVQSRGWLFTLPIVIVLAIVVSADRLRVVMAAVLPIAAVLVPLHRLLDVYQAGQGVALDHAATRAGQASLVICALALVLGTLLAWGDRLRGARRLSAGQSRAVGAVVTVVAVMAVVAGGLAATHGHPVRFVVRQWNGFSTQQQVSSKQSHFGDVGSGRYDFWRVSLDAVVSHPIGGLGQDNFADYYVRRRRTSEEPSWTHSLELRLLAHTGLVGFLLFVGFLIAAVAAAVRARRTQDPVGRAAAGVAMLALIVWVVHGSVDWFWEIPGLSGPALGFLGMAAALATRGEGARVAGPQRIAGRVPRPAAVAAGLAVLVAGVVVLGLPYLSVREVSLASNTRFTDPAAALADLDRAAQLNPLDATPGRLAGAIALQMGQYGVAEQRFQQSISREPGGWFAWLGAGVAASALGRTPVAVRDFRVAYGINSRQPVISTALARARSFHPLTYDEMLKLLVLVH